MLSARRYLSAIAFGCMGLVTASSACAVDLVGYIPSYRMSATSYINNTLPKQLELLDEIRYFGITVNSDGTLTTNSAHLNDPATLRQKIDAMPLADRPRLVVSLGGAGISSGFSSVAGDASRRSTLAGNIDSLLNQVGAAGIDFDWEHPADGAELNTNYPLLLERVKQELGSDRVYATVAPSKILPHSVFTGPDAVDGVSIMTYDIGWWAGDPSDPNLGQHSLPEYTEEAIDAWTGPQGASIPRTWVFGNKKSVDAPEDRLGVGIPFYSRGYAGSSAGSAFAYSDLVAGGTTSDGNAYQFNGENHWITGPQLVAERIQLANDRGLQFAFIWELFHDLDPDNPSSLLRAAFDANTPVVAVEGDLDGDGFVGIIDLNIVLSAWNQSVPPADPLADPSGDGFVGIDDLNLVLGNWNTGTPPSSDANRQLPEPGSVLVMGLCCSAMTGRRPQS